MWLLLIPGAWAAYRYNEAKKLGVPLEYAFKHWDRSVRSLRAELDRRDEMTTLNPFKGFAGGRR